MRAGAIGYLLKDTEAEELRPRHQGRRRRPGAALAAGGRAAAAGGARAGAPGVADRARGRGAAAPGARPANKEIAGELRIGEKTVKTHVSSILGKLGVQSRTQAALYAGRVGLVPADQLGSAGTIPR